MSSPKDSKPAPEGEADPSEEYVLHDLTELVRRAKRGLRRDVAPLAAAVDAGGLLVPLAKSIEGVPVGEVIETDSEELTLVPHLLQIDDGAAFVPLFTDSDILRSIGDYVEWTTEGKELEFCTLPARVAIDLALQVVDGEEVVGAVVNPSDETELYLQRHELGALAQGKALPLVGYVEAIPQLADEEVLIAELEQPPSAEMTDSIEACLEGVAHVLGYRIEQTFNAERDLEPHPTLSIELAAGKADEVDTDALGAELFEQLEGQLPPPGYIDVIFEEREAE